MAVVHVHTKSNCKYCDKAKQFLHDINLQYSETFYDEDSEEYTSLKEKLIGATGCRTFPQLFVSGVFIGGYSDLLHKYDTLALHKLLEKHGVFLEYDF